MPNATLPEWERVLAAAAHLQRILPDAVLVGGTASAVYARHRLSTDADHVLTDLRQRFDEVLGELESVAGWQVQLAQPLPYDLDEVDLSEYKSLAPVWHEWSAVKAACIRCAELVFDRIIGVEQ